MTTSISSNIQNSYVTASYMQETQAVSAEVTAAPVKKTKGGAQPVQDGFEAKAGGAVVKDGGNAGISVPAQGTKNEIGEWRKLEAEAYQRNMSHMAVGEQGMNNSCGTTSEAMALSTFGLPFDQKTDFTVIDKAIRPWGFGAGTPTGPSDIVDFARDMGMQAQQYSKCDVEDIAKQLREGRTVTVLCNYESPLDKMFNQSTQGSIVHYVNITGVERDAEGKISAVHVRNPWGSSYTNETIPVEDFKKMWTDVRAAGSSVGGIQDILRAVPVCDRTMIVIDKPDAKPLEDPNFFHNLYDNNTNLVMSGFNGLAASVTTIKNDSVIAGLGQMTGNVINTVVGGYCYVMGNLIGKNLEKGGDKLMEIGKNMMQGDTLHKVGGGLAFFFGAIAKAVGWIYSTLTNLVSGLTGFLTNLITAKGEKARTREAAAEAILGEKNATAEASKTRRETAVAQMETASVGTKAKLIDLLTDNGKANNRHQDAAVAVLEAAKLNGDLGDLVAELGGADKVAQMFNGSAAEEANAILSTLQKKGGHEKKVSA